METHASFAYIHAKILLLVLLTFEIQTHVNTQTNLHSFHTFRQKESRITDWHSYVFKYNIINVASRDLQRNASFQPTHLHHSAMLFIFEKIKKGDKQFFNVSVDLRNEFSNGSKLQLKIDQ